MRNGEREENHRKERKNTKVTLRRDRRKNNSEREKEKQRGE